MKTQMWSTNRPLRIAKNLYLLDSCKSQAELRMGNSLSDEREKIRILVGEAVANSGIDIEIADDTSLVESGVLDSFSIVNLVQELQMSFDVDLDFADITVENFDSINALASFIGTKAD